LKKLLNLRLFCVIISLILLLNIQILTVKAANTTYYVSPTGNDLNIGTQQILPFKTIYKASQVAVAGDTIIIGAGEYRETVTPTNSGTANAPITYKSAPGEKVTINGCDIVTAPFTQYNNNIYVANVNLDLGDGNQVFISNNMMIDARWPNQNTAATDTTWLLEPNLAAGIEGTATKLTSDPYFNTYRQTFKQLPTDNLTVNPTGGKIWVGTFKHLGWCAYTGVVESFDSSIKKVTFSTNNFVTEWEQCLLDRGAKDCDYYLFGKLDYLDNAKEYYYDQTNSKLYVWQPNGGIPSANTVQYKKRNYAFDLRGKSNIKLDGIDFFASTTATSDTSTGISINNLNAKYISHFSTSECNLSLPGSRVNDTGFIIKGSQNEIINCNIQFSAGNGLNIAGNNNKAINNIISDCDYLGMYSANVMLNGNKNTISYNTITRAGRSGLTGNPYECKVTNNEIFKVNMLSADGGCIYFGFADGANTEIAYNKLYDHYGEKRLGTGLYIDSYSSNYIIHHNLTEGLYLNENYNYGNINNDTRTGFIIANNTVFGQGFSAPLQAQVNHDYSTTLGNFIVNNIFLPKQSYTYTGLDTKAPPMYFATNWTENRQGDPLLNSDYTLKENSPCRNYEGVEKYDYINNNVQDGKVDIGAFEYGEPVWKCGFQTTYTEPQFQTLSIPLINLVRNAGFDTGEDSVWAYSGSGYKINNGGKSGVYCAYLPNSTSKATQTITGLKPNQKYELFGFSQVQASGGKPILRIIGNGLIGNTVHNANTAVQSGIMGKEYSFGRIEFETTTDTTVTISIENAGSAAVKWDSISLSIIIPDGLQLPVIDFWGLVSNGGFEEGTFGWFGLNYGSVTTSYEIKNDVVYSGRNSLYVTRNGHNSSPGQLVNSVEKNKKYNISAFVKAAIPISGYNAKLFLTVSYTDSSKDYLYGNPVDISAGNWKEVSYLYYYTGLKEISTVQVCVLTSGGTGITNYNYYLDNISMKSLRKINMIYSPGGTINETPGVVVGIADSAITFGGYDSNGNMVNGTISSPYDQWSNIFTQTGANNYKGFKPASSSNKVWVLVDFGGYAKVNGIDIQSIYSNVNGCDLYFSDTLSDLTNAIPNSIQSAPNNGNYITADFSPILAKYCKIVFTESYAGQFYNYGLNFKKIYIKTQNVANLVGDSSPLSVNSGTFNWVIKDINNQVVDSGSNVSFDANGGFNILCFINALSLTTPYKLEINGGSFNNFVKKFYVNSAIHNDISVNSISYKTFGGNYYKPGNKFIKVNMSVQNNGATTKDMTMIYVIYQNGKLSKINIGDSNAINASLSGNATLAFELPQPYNNVSIVGYVWDGVSSLSPLTQKIEQTYNDNVFINIE
jgi:hypothetical protein